MTCFTLQKRTEPERSDAGVYEVGIDGFEEDVFYGVDGKAVHDE